MEYLLEFKNFVKSYQKLNEGGGAGKDFIFDDITYELTLNYTKTGIKAVKKYVNLGTAMDLIGYNEEMSDIDVNGLFETDILFKIDEELLSELPISELRKSDDKVFKGLDGDTTLGEIAKDKDIQILIEGSGKANYMYGSGWILKAMEKGTEIEIKTIDIGDGLSTWIDNVNVFDCLENMCDLNVKVKLTATEKMNQLWNDLFNPESYTDYKEQAIKDGEDVLSEEEFYELQQQDLHTNYGVEK